MAGACSWVGFMVIVKLFVVLCNSYTCILVPFPKKRKLIASRERLNSKEMVKLSISKLGSQSSAKYSEPNS